MIAEVKTFAEVRKRIPEALFLMLGTVSPTAIQWARDQQILDQIVPTGWVTDADLPHYLACADVLFCPLQAGLNDRARWPAKILDYLSAGRGRN